MSPRNIYFPLYVRQTAEEFHARLASSPQYATRWARQAAVDGRPEAQLAWGHMLLTGHGTPRDAEAAYRWFRTAARSGFGEALNMVGRCHELGWGVPVDAAAAAQWYRRAADEQNAWGEFNLGSLLLSGDGVPTDRAEALKLFVRAARGGNEKAMNMLGRFREEGWHGRVKLSSARRWYDRAATRGCFRAQFHFARFLADEGALDEAVRWFNASFATAPHDFCREAGAVLAAHPNGRLASIGREALARACGMVPSTAAVVAASALVSRGA